MRLAGAGIFFLLLAGCGYHFAGGGGETFHPAVRSVYVDAFINRTSEANVDNLLRTAFNSEFVQGGRFKLAVSPAEADAIFKGAIVTLVASPLAYKPTNLSAEDRITVVLELSLEESQTGKVLWSNRSFTSTGDYAVTSVGVTETSRRNALTKLAIDTAERAYRLMLSDF